MSSSHCVRLLSGSQVRSSAPYPFQCTRYSIRRYLVLLPKIFSTSNSSVSGSIGGGASWIVREGKSVSGSRYRLLRLSCDNQLVVINENTLIVTPKKIK